MPTRAAMTRTRTIRRRREMLFMWRSLLRGTGRIGTGVSPPPIGGLLVRLVAFLELFLARPGDADRSCLRAVPGEVVVPGAADHAVDAAVGGERLVGRGAEDQVVGGGAGRADHDLRETEARTLGRRQALRGDRCRPQPGVGG